MVCCFNLFKKGVIITLLKHSKFVFGIWRRIQYYYFSKHYPLHRFTKIFKSIYSNLFCICLKLICLRLVYSQIPQKVGETCNLGESFKKTFWVILKPIFERIVETKYFCYKVSIQIVLNLRIFIKNCYDIYFKQSEIDIQDFFFILENKMIRLSNKILSDQSSGRHLWFYF